MAVKDRCFPRHRTTNGIQAGFIASSLRIGGEVQAISPRGVFLRTNQAVVVGTPGKFGAQFPKGFLRARVVVSSVEPGRGIGFEFINMNSIGRNLLQLFCGSLWHAASQHHQSGAGTKSTHRAKETQESGFSLIELLIVVAIILIIAAIAIPNLLQSRIVANQSSSVTACRVVSSAELTYSVTYNIGFSPDLLSLGPPSSGISTSSAAGLIDSVLAAGSKSGYNFVYTPGSVVGGQISSYTLNANPATPGTTGTQYYFMDVSGVIRRNATTTASAADSPVAN